MKHTLKNTTVSLRFERIQDLDVDAIVVGVDTALAPRGAAAAAALGGGGDRTVPETTGPRTVRTGDALQASAGAGRAKSVVFACGPEWSDGMRGENVLLERAYWRALERAAEAGAKSTAALTLETELGFPDEPGALIALATVFRFAAEGEAALEAITIVPPLEATELYQRVFAEVVRTQVGT